MTTAETAILLKLEGVETVGGEAASFVFKIKAGCPLKRMTDYVAGLVNLPASKLIFVCTDSGRVIDEKLSSIQMGLSNNDEVFVYVKKEAAVIPVFRIGEKK